MKVAIMQPYFFPYPGYFSLMQAVDMFVFLTDVQYTRRSWMNRNRILNRSAAEGWDYIHMPVLYAKRETLFCEIETHSGKDALSRIERQLVHHYGTAPHRAAVITFLKELWDVPLKSLAEFNMKSLRALAQMMGITAKFIDSREVAVEKDLPAEDRLIALTQSLQADTYINLPGGRTLYSAGNWTRQGLQLLFLEPKLPPYKQGDGPFIPALSVIDMLMWNSLETVRASVARDYDLKS